MKIKSLLIVLILLININVLALSETDITNVKINGESINCENYVCNATVNSEKVKIEYTLVDSDATSQGFASGAEFTFTDTTMVKKLVVSKQVEGFDTPLSSEYVFNLTKHLMSNDYTVKKMTLNGQNIPIKKDIYVYNTKVKYDVTDLVLDVTPNNSFAKVSVITDSYFDTGDSNKAVDFVVTSESGEEKEYRIIVVREERPDTSIKSIKLSSGVIDLERNLYEYKVNVPYDVNEIEIDVTTSDPNAYFDIKREDKLVVGENTITITVSNKELKQDYTIIINRLDNSEEATVNLKELKITDYDLNFKPGVNEYDLYFDDIPNRLSIKATPVNEKNEVKIDGNRNLKDGNSITITVIQNSLGLSKEYILNIHQNTISKKSNILLFIIIALVIISLIVTIIIIKKKKKKKKLKNKKIEKQRIVAITFDKDDEDNTKEEESDNSDDDDIDEII